MKKMVSMLLNLLKQDTVQSSFQLVGSNAFVNHLGQYYLKQVELDSNQISSTNTSYHFEVCIVNSDSIYINGMLGNSFVLQHELLEFQRVNNGKGASPLYEISFKVHRGESDLTIKVASSLIEIIIQNHLRIMNELALANYKELYADLDPHQLRKLEEEQQLRILIKNRLIHCSFAIRPSDLLENEPKIEWQN